MSRDFEVSSNDSCNSWKKISSYLNEIWYVGGGRWVMHDGMQYDQIQGQGQGHEPLKVGNSTISDGYLHPIYKGAGKWQQILKLRHNI